MIRPRGALTCTRFGTTPCSCSTAGCCRQRCPSPVRTDHSTRPLSRPGEVPHLWDDGHLRGSVVLRRAAEALPSVCGTFLATEIQGYVRYAFLRFRPHDGEVGVWGLTRRDLGPKTPRSDSRKGFGHIVGEPGSTEAIKFAEHGRATISVALPEAAKITGDKSGRYGLGYSSGANFYDF